MVRRTFNGLPLRGCSSCGALVSWRGSPLSSCLRWRCASCRRTVMFLREQTLLMRTRDNAGQVAEDEPHERRAACAGVLSFSFWRLYLVEMRPYLMFLSAATGVAGVAFAPGVGP